MRSNMSDGFLTLANTRNIVSAEWEIGWQEVRRTEWEGILFYDRYVNRFFSGFAGVDALGAGDTLDETRGVIGFRYVVPLNFHLRAWVDTDGGARVNLGKSFELTPRLALGGEAQYDSHDQWEGKVRLSYLVRKSLSFVGQWHSDYGIGGGLQIRL